MAKRRPSGDGMVRKREDGRWEGRIVVGHKSNGDSIFRYLSAGSQKELLAKLHRNIEEYRDVDLREESKMPLGEWLDRWLEEYAAPSVRPSTLEGYLGYVERNIKPRLGDKPVGKITAEDIRQLYRELQEHGRQEEHPQYGYKLADSTIRRIHGVLHEALDAAAQENLIARNPTDGIILPRKKAVPKQVLNDAQLERFMTAIREDKVWHDFFYTELTTGLRRGEICGLMWQDFDEVHGTLTVRRTIHAERGGRLTAGETKTGAGKRIITLPPSTAQLLSERRKRSYTEWIFPDFLRPERPTRPNAAYVRMKELLKKAGLPSIRFHDLRHPYVKHTTKNFSLRLMDFQAQAYPDARRKTHGACQLHRGGQSRSPVRPLCNRKRFSCLPPQSKISWILYATSIRLSGYTSTRSISSSASSVVSVSASKIALDASLRLSCRACSSCFCFACANTAA